MSVTFAKCYYLSKQIYENSAFWTFRYAFVNMVAHGQVFTDEFLDKFIFSYVIKGIFGAWRGITSLSSFLSLANDTLSVFATQLFTQDQVFLNGSPWTNTGTPVLNKENHHRKRKEICDGKKRTKFCLPMDRKKWKLVKKSLLVCNQLKSNRNTCTVVSDCSLKCENVCCVF